MSKKEETAILKRSKSLREQPFVVQCMDVRCMAYRDANGKWVDYFHGDELKGEVRIISES